MKTPFGLLALATCCLPVAALAQGVAAPSADALRTIAQRQSKHLIAAAETMPADKYGFKPTPAQMTFGKIVVHLSMGNDYLCSKISGAAAPKRTEITDAAAKDKLVARLRESFQFCESALAKVNDADLSARVPFFGGHDVSRAEAMFATAEDWADHYSQMAIYLRLNGLLPPTAKEKE